MTLTASSPSGSLTGEPEGTVLLRRIQVLAAGLAEVDVAVMPAKDSIRTIAGIEAMLAACRGRVIRAGAAAEAQRDGAASKQQWMAGVTNTDTGQAAGQARLAEELAGACHTEEALGRGQISDRHARIITDTLSRLPAHLTAGQKVVVERELVRVAGQVSPSQLRREARRALAAVEPDPDAVDAHEDRLVQDEEDAARAAAWFRWFDRPDGTTKGEFVVPTLQAHMLKKVLHAMAAPRRMQRDGTTHNTAPRHTHTNTSTTSTIRGTGDTGHGTGGTGNDSGTNGTAGASSNTGTTSGTSRGTGHDTGAAASHGGADGDAASDLFTDADGRSAGGATSTGGGTANGSSTHAADDDGGGGGLVGVDFDAVPVTGEQDPADVGADLTWAQRLGRALTDLLDHLPVDHLSCASGMTMVVNIDEADLRQRTARVVGTDTADAISAGQLRRLACNAGILPAVFGRAPVPVDLGRKARLFSDHQRLLLAQNYTACAAAGCDRPYAWCELHHLNPWNPTGPTNLDNALPLCSYHHHLIHHTDYHHTLTPTTRTTTTTNSASTSSTGRGDLPDRGGGSTSSSSSSGGRHGTNTSAPGWRRRTRQAGTGTTLPTYTITYRKRT